MRERFSDNSEAAEDSEVDSESRGDDGGRAEGCLPSDQSGRGSRGAKRAGDEWVEQPLLTTHEFPIPLAQSSNDWTQHRTPL
jgi:hypothetical protein